MNRPREEKGSNESRVEKTVRSGDALIVPQAFGAPGGPKVLLIKGQMASMLRWPNALCAQSARAGRFVIRYDKRDTGRRPAIRQASRPTPTPSRAS